MVFGVGRHKLTILYKSGNKVHVRADEFVVTPYADHSGVMKLSWKGMGPKSPVWAGLDNIEAVYNGWV